VVEQKAYLKLYHHRCNYFPDTSKGISVDSDKSIRCNVRELFDTDMELASLYIAVFLDDRITLIYWEVLKNRISSLLENLYHISSSLLGKNQMNHNSCFMQITVKYIFTA
jgi:hypothetical protein